MKILNIGLDRDLLETGPLSEAQKRQLVYCERLPAQILHIVKATATEDSNSRSLSASLTVIPCTVSHWIFFPLKAMFLAIKILTLEKVDVIQVQDPFLTGPIGLILSRFFKLPLIVGIYSDEIDNPVWLKASPLNHIANFIGKWVLRSATVSRTDSLAIKNKLSNYGFSNLVYIPFLITNADQFLSFDADSNLVRENLLSGKRGPLCIAVSRLEQEKNIFLMLDVISQVVKYNPEVVLAIAGNGVLYSELVDYADRVAPNAVRWLGKIDNEQLAAYYQASDILLLSSDRESAARVLYESALAGIPAISTDTAGARDIIDDGITGKIVPIRDVAKFSEELLKLINRGQKMKEMGSAAKEKVSALASSDAVLKKLNYLYSLTSKSF